MKLLDICVTNQKIPETDIRELLANAHPVHLGLSLSGYRADGLDTLLGYLLAYHTVQVLELKLSVAEFQLEKVSARLVRSFC